jgi:hypothetical protein
MPCVFVGVVDFVYNACLFVGFVIWILALR